MSNRTVHDFPVFKDQHVTPKAVTPSTDAYTHGHIEYLCPNSFKIIKSAIYKYLHQKKALGADVSFWENCLGLKPQGMVADIYDALPDWIESHMDKNHPSYKHKFIWFFLKEVKKEYMVPVADDPYGHISGGKFTAEQIRKSAKGSPGSASPPVHIKPASSMPTGNRKSTVPAKPSPLKRHSLPDDGDNNRESTSRPRIEKSARNPETTSRPAPDASVPGMPGTPLSALTKRLFGCTVPAQPPAELGLNVKNVNIFPEWDGVGLGTSFSYEEVCGGDDTAQPKLVYLYQLLAEDCAFNAEQHVVGWYREEAFTEVRRDGQLKSALSLAALHGITEAIFVIKNKVERMTIPPSPIKVDAGTSRTTNDYLPLDPAGPGTPNKSLETGPAIGFTPINSAKTSSAVDVLSPPLSPKTPKRPGTATSDDDSPTKKSKPNESRRKPVKRKSDTDPEDLPTPARPAKVRKPTSKPFSLEKLLSSGSELIPLSVDKDMELIDDLEPIEEYEIIPESVPSGLVDNDEDIRRDDTFWINLQADEWETDLETGEQRLKSVKARIDDVMNSGALEHWSETDWSRFCCSVVGHDPLETVETFVRDGVEIRNVKYLVDVPGYGTLEPPNPKPVGWLRPAKRRLRPHQWNGVCYMGKQENEVWGGGFLADEMGFGKTTTAIAHVVVQAQMKKMVNDIISSKSLRRAPGAVTRDAKKQLLHNDFPAQRGYLRGEVPTDDSDLSPCPVRVASNEHPQFLCICETHKYADYKFFGDSYGKPIKSGITIFVVPHSLNQNWKKELRFAQSLVMIDCTREGVNLTMNLVTQLLSRHHCTLDEIVVLTNQPAVLESRVFSGLFHNYQETGVAATPGKSPATRRRTGTQVATTITDNTGEKNHKSCRISSKPVGQKYSSIAAKAVLKIPVARIIVDEAHMMRGESSRLNFMIKVCGAKVWWLTGTAFESGPGDVKNQLHAMANFQWPDHTDTQYVLSERFDQLCRDGATEAKTSRTGDAVESIAQRFGELLEKVMMRRGDSSRMWGHRVIEYPNSINYQRICKFDLIKNRKLREDVRKFVLKEESDTQNFLENKAREQSGSLLTNNTTFVPAAGDTRDARITAAIPGVRMLSKNYGQQDIDKYVKAWLPKIRDEKFGPVPDEPHPEDPWHGRIEELIASSPKLIYLLDDAIPKFVSKRRTVDSGRKIRKGLVFTNFPIVSYLVFLAIRSRGFNVREVSQAVTPEGRGLLTELFHDDTDEVQFLVGTYSIMGVGFNLVAATVSWYFEPAISNAGQLQAAKRMARAGQESTSEGFMLFLEHADIERNTYDINTNKTSFAKLTLDRKTTKTDDYNTVAAAMGIRAPLPSALKYGTGSGTATDIPIPRHGGAFIDDGVNKRTSTAEAHLPTMVRAAAPDPFAPVARIPVIGGTLRTTFNDFLNQPGQPSTYRSGMGPGRAPRSPVRAEYQSSGGASGSDAVSSSRLFGTGFGDRLSRNESARMVSRIPKLGSGLTSPDRSTTIRAPGSGTLNYPPTPPTRDPRQKIRKLGTSPTWRHYDDHRFDDDP